MVSINEYGDSVHDVAIMWLDNNRQFFVGNDEPATAEERLYCVRWCQVEEQIDNLKPELVETVLNLPVMIEAYYSDFGAINRHNKQHQYDLEIERKIRTKHWWKRTNASIFRMINFDTMNVHKEWAGPEDTEEDSNEWCTALTYELIVNMVKEQRRRSSNTG